MLVAGLMVHCHALRAGIVHARPTHDTDLVVEIGAVSYAEVARAILGLGFTLHEPLDSHAPVHRCVDGAGAIVDLMASDRRQEPARYVGRPVIHVPGSDPALKRTISHVLPTGGVVRLPDLPSALALESGAYFLPGVERERHLQGRGRAAGVHRPWRGDSVEVDAPRRDKAPERDQHDARGVAGVPPGRLGEGRSRGARAGCVLAATRIHPSEASWARPGLILGGEP